MIHQPPHAPPQPPRRRTSPAVIILITVLGIAILAVLGIVVLAAASGGSGGTNASGSGGGRPAASVTHHAGSAVTEGKWEFRVAQSDHTHRVKGDGGSRVAQGKFVQIWLAVTNHAATARYISADDQKLLAGTHAYGVDVDATVTVDEGPEVGLPERINPGSTETIELVYDVPETVQPTGVEVHASETSAGVRVALPAT